MNFNDHKKHIVISFFYILPIILAGTYYADDMGRAYRGHSWDGDGRFIANFIINALSFCNGILSTFPYSLIISTTIFMMAGISLHKLLFNSEGCSVKKHALPLLLLTSPFLLENLSYRFDSIPMALSLFIVTIPFHFIDKKKFIPLSVLCVFVSLGLYQISSMLYVSIGILIMIERLLSKDEYINIRLSTYIITSFLIGYYLYSFIIAKFGFVLNRNGILPMELNSLLIVKSRILKYIENFKLLLQSGYYIVVIPLALFFVCSSISYAMENIYKCFLKIIIFALLFSCLLITTLMPNIVINTAYITARTFIGFPLLLLAVLIYIDSSSTQLRNKMVSASAIIAIIFSFFLCSQYSTAIKQNEDFNNYVATALSQVTGLNTESADKYVTIAGATSGGRRGWLIYHKVPFLKLLAPQYMSEGWGWGGVSLSRYTNIHWISDWRDIVKNKCKDKIIFNNGDFVIRKIESQPKYIVDFSPGVCK